MHIDIMHIGQDGVGLGDIYQGGKGGIAEGEFIKLSREGPGLRPALPTDQGAIAPQRPPAVDRAQEMR